MTHYNPSNGEGGRGRRAYTDENMKAHTHTPTHIHIQYIHTHRKRILKVSCKLFFDFFPFKGLINTNKHIHSHNNCFFAIAKLGRWCEGHSRDKPLRESLDGLTRKEEEECMNSPFGVTTKDKN